MKKIQRILFSAIFLLVFSCSEKLDFSQIEDYTASPVFTSSLTYFTVLPIQFFDPTGTVVINEISDITDFRVFENEFVRKNLVKVEFDVEVKNEFSRGFTLKVDLLNDNNSSVYRFNDLNIAAGNLNFIHFEEVEINNNPSIKNATRVKITLEIEQTGPPLDPQDTSEFEFKSSATMYIESSL